MRTEFQIKLPLEALMSETVEAALERERCSLDALLAANGGRVVIVGAGSTGKRALACLRSIDVEPLAMADDNPDLHGVTIDGLVVLRHSEAAERYGDDAVFIVAIWNAKHWYSVTAANLRRHGCVTVAPVGAIYWRFATTFLPFFVQDLPHKVLEEKDDVLRAGNIWADEQSCREYLAHVRWRTHGDAGALPGRPHEESYFPDDIFNLCADEALIDCGAYDGDTLRSFLSRRADRFRHIDAIEPSPRTFDQLQTYVSTLPKAIQEKIALHPVAVGAEAGTVRFDATCGVDSHVSEHGEVVVTLQTLDELCGASQPTFLKMDIEGAEFEALLGARGIIRDHAPILAICLEHYQNDLWRLPLLVHDMIPEYAMYLRTYEGDGWQSVAYAVPPGRIRAKESLR